MTETTRVVIDDLLTRRVEEVKYLIEKKAPVYRPIIRYLYDRYESSETGWVWPAEVLEFMRRRHPDGASYSEAECEQDLRQLESWGVLVSEHDVNQATTIEEFVRAAKRYQITETTRVIEDMLQRLLEPDGPRGSLDTSRLDRLWQALLQLDEMLRDLKVHSAGRDTLHRIEAAWNAAEDARGQIRDQANRYLRELDHDRMPDASDLKPFLQYKRMLRTYLDEFALGLKDFMERSRGLLRGWAAEGLDERLAAALARNDQERKGDPRESQELHQAYLGRIRALRGFSGPSGTAEILLAKTTARVRMMVEAIERVVTERRNAPDRKRELEQLALAFRHAPSTEFSHQLAAVAFGWAAPRHTRLYTADSATEVQSDASVWHQDPWDVELRVRKKGNRTFHAVTAMQDRSLEKAKLRARLIEQRQAEGRFWDELFGGSELELSGLVLREAGARGKVFRMVRDCLRSPDRAIRLEDGSRVRLLPPEDPEMVAEVVAPDGVLYTRAYRFHRQPGRRV